MKYNTDTTRENTYKDEGVPNCGSKEYPSRTPAPKVWDEGIDLHVDGCLRPVSNDLHVTIRGVDEGKHSRGAPGWDRLAPDRERRRNAAQRSGARESEGRADDIRDARTARPVDHSHGRRWPRITVASCAPPLALASAAPPKPPPVDATFTSGPADAAILLTATA